MNVRLLRRIAKVIQEKPKEFYMGYFTGETKCGITHCIGGWAAVLSGVKEEETSVGEMCALLGVTEGQRENLFYPDYANAWVDYGMYKATPKQAAARIEHFIKTKGAE